MLAPAAPPAGSSPAVLSSVVLQRRGEILELHFKLRGAPQTPRPKMQVTAHGHELWVDLGQVGLDLPPRPLFGAEAPPLMALRAIEAPAGGSRLVVQVAGKTDYAIAQIPGEIVLRLAPAGAAPNLAAPLVVRTNTPQPRTPSIASAPAPLERSADRQDVREQSRGAPPHRTVEKLVAEARVVIDPGHGGFDPGARDSSGEFAEKDLALQISLLAAQALEARGVKVQMTRRSDRFLSLAERTKVANAADADLFVSIHLNSSPNPQTSGIEVYYLNNTTDRAALRLARMENGGGRRYSAPGEPNLNYILSDLVQNNKAAESASLARMIEAQTVTELDQAFGLGVRPLGAKMGPFYVLVGAQMPAVLVECGFLSNDAEAARLRTPAYQEDLADGIAAAVVRYLNADLASGNL